jgi:pimeloyl-ACP methyl ester carboxylesterase
MVYVAPPDDVGNFLHVVGRLIGLPDKVILGAQKVIEKRFDVRFEELLPSGVAGRLTQPLLAIHDHDDREVTVEEVKRLAAAWPGAELRLTEGLGHRRILRDPEVLREAVEFVDADPGLRRPRAA